MPDDGVLGCEGNAHRELVDDSTSDASGLCYGNQAFYLLNAAGVRHQRVCNRKDCNGDGTYDGKFSLLPGTDGENSLNSGKWGISKDDLVIR
jgi:hypothetical protein